MDSVVFAVCAASSKLGAIKCSNYTPSFHPAVRERVLGTQGFTSINSRSPHNTIISPILQEETEAQRGSVICPRSLKLVEGGAGIPTQFPNLCYVASPHS